MMTAKQKVRLVTMLQIVQVQVQNLICRSQPERCTVSQTWYVWHPSYYGKPPVVRVCLCRSLLLYVKLLHVCAFMMHPCSRVLLQVCDVTFLLLVAAGTAYEKTPS